MVRLSILISLLVIVSACSSETSEVEETQVIQFEESANFIQRDINAALPEDRFSEIVFTEFRVELTDSLLIFAFDAEDDWSYSLDMTMNRDSLGQEIIGANSFRAWKSSSLGGGSLWNRDEISITLDTIEAIKGGKISGSYRSPEDVRYIYGEFEVALDTIH